MSGFGNVPSVLKYRKRDNVYRNSTENCVYDIDAEIATSYRWWVFVKRIKGKLVFNGHYYSSSTAYHQRAVRDLLKKLKVKIDVEVDTRSSLDNFGALSQRLEEVYETMFIAQHKIDTQFMGAKVKANREFEIEHAQKQIKMYKSIGVKTKRDLNEIMESAVSKYEYEASLQRERNRQERKEKTKANPELIKSMNSLKPLEYGKAFEKFNNLSGV
jgi:hypothetical protein